MSQGMMIDLMVKYVTENYSSVAPDKPGMNYDAHAIRLRENKGTFVIYGAGRIIPSRHIRHYVEYVGQIEATPSTSSPSELDYWELLLHQLNRFNAIRLRWRLLRFTRAVIKSEKKEKIKESVRELGLK